MVSRTKTKGIYFLGLIWLTDSLLVFPNWSILGGDPPCNEWAGSTDVSDTEVAEKFRQHQEIS